MVDFITFFDGSGGIGAIEGNGVSGFFLPCGRH